MDRVICIGGCALYAGCSYGERLPVRGRKGSGEMCAKKKIGISVVNVWGFSEVTRIGFLGLGRTGDK